MANYCFPPQWGWGTGGAGLISQQSCYRAKVFGYPDRVLAEELDGTPRDKAFVLFAPISPPKSGSRWEAIRSGYERSANDPCPTWGDLVEPNHTNDPIPPYAGESGEIGPGRHGMPRIVPARPDHVVNPGLMPPIDEPAHATADGIQNIEHDPSRNRQMKRDRGRRIVVGDHRACSGRFRACTAGGRTL